MSLFSLPVSRGARLARIFVVLALDLVLAGAGLAMILAYLDERSRAQESAPAPADAGAVAAVEALPPVPAAPEAPSESTESTGPGPGKAERGADRSREGGGPESRAEERRRPRDPDPAGAKRESGGAKAAAEAETSAADAAPPGGDPSAEEVQTLARQIQLVVGRHQAQLERCYQRSAKATSPSQPLEGRIEIRFTVMPDGSAADVAPAGNTTGSEELARCVAGLVESWTFPAGRSQELPFVWPFRFTAPE